MESNNVQWHSANSDEPTTSSLDRCDSSKVATGKFVYGFLSHGLNGITAALDFIPTCTNNGFECGIKAFRIFFWELGKSFDISEFDARFSQIFVCLVVFFIPFLREIVLTCLTFSITLIFALLIKVLKVSRNRPPRRSLGHSRSSHWSLTIWKNAFKKVKERFRTSTFQRPSHSTKQKSPVNTNALDTSLSCLVCYEKPKCVLLLPCKHACLCLDCTKTLLQRQQLCPLCRKPIITAMQIYI